MAARIQRLKRLTNDGPGYESNAATTARCATQSVGSGLRWNHSRLMHLGCCPARTLWMMAGSRSVRRSNSLTVEWCRPSLTCPP